nr:MAG TPA: hypothetical protein [Caudoviricetes sp.]
MSGCVVYSRCISVLIGSIKRNGAPLTKLLTLKLYML